MQTWWDNVIKMGPSCKYYVNSEKTWLPADEIVKYTFVDTVINITIEERLRLGIPLGYPKYVQKFVSDKINQWCEELVQLFSFAKTQPNAAFAAFTKSLTICWAFFFRTTPYISVLLHSLEDVIRC